MSKKYAILGFVFVAVVAGASWLCYDYQPFHAISPLTYYRIELGMSAQQVEDIIGKPPGRYGPPSPMGTRIYPWDTITETGVFQELKPDQRFQGAWWSGTRHAITIQWDDDCFVIGKRLQKMNKYGP